MKVSDYVMNSLVYDIIKEAIACGKYNVISECNKIVNHDKCDVVVEQYTGDNMRVFKNSKGEVCVLMPEVVGFMESEYLSNAIASGSLFDDADRVENASTYVVKTTLPEQSMIRQGFTPPTDKLLPVVGATIGTVDDGCVGCDETNLRNGYAIMKDLMVTEPETSMHDIVDNYIGVDDMKDTPHNLSGDFYGIQTAMNELNDYDGDDNILDDDLIEYEIGDDEEDEIHQEAFFNKPKKLKPIPAREIVSYVTVEMNAVRDTNDQAMLSGYVCAKLELADFYLSCIDTRDPKYIVPHDRAFIVRFQQDLNRLLTQILKLRPINKNDRAWKVDVTYPKGWEG